MSQLNQLYRLIRSRHTPVAQDILLHRDDLIVAQRDDDYMSVRFDDQEIWITQREWLYVAHLLTRDWPAIDVVKPEPKPLFTFKLFGLTLAVGRA